MIDLRFPELVNGLYVISVPIGNLGDITLRALNVLSKVDVIYCEDTRVTRKLLSLYNIKTPKLVRLDNHTVLDQLVTVEDDISNNKKVALTSDAGTPVISDPGYELIKHLIGKDIRIISVPGACSAIAAISISGLPSDKFTFLGFLPKKTNARINYIKENIKCGTTNIIYERAERLISLLQDLYTIHPNCNVAISKEITKKFEEFYNGTIVDTINQIGEKTLKGEIVLSVYVPIENSKEISKEKITSEVKSKIYEGKKVKEIVSEFTGTSNISKSTIYKWVQSIKDDLEKK